MTSNPKRPKVARSTSVKPEEDRLSSFPDTVLCHILSFLPTKYAATTSVLSTRWKYLSLGVPKIDLDESLLLKLQEKQGSCRFNENAAFINFVNRRLMLCKAFSITEFRLKCRRLLEVPVIDLWLTILLFLKVEVLEIEVQSPDSPALCLPSGVFGSETLSVLKLCGRNIVLRIPEIVCFPNLKILNLKDVEIQYSESNNFRFAEEGYPLLQNLRLEEIRLQKKEDGTTAALGISILTLKVLAIIGLNFELRSLHIDTPHLQHLECDAGLVTPFMQINLNEGKSLVSADLSVSPLMVVLYPGQWYIKLLSKVNNVKELHLSEGFSEGLSTYSPGYSRPLCPVLAPDSLPEFLNLTHLELTAIDEAVRILLQRAPNLKSLVCKMEKDGNSLLPKNQPRCLAHNLREIRIRNFTSAEAELETVRYFLQHGAVLERMTIERPSDGIEEWKLLTLKQLMKVARRSPRCEIELI